MNKNWKSVERVRWEPNEDQLLLEQINIHSKESHMDLARKIISNSLIEGRTLDAIEQRIGWMRAKKRR
jgi:hypothetical protein